MIPESSRIFKQLKDLVSTSSVLIVSGLPGVGKSLYVNQILDIARTNAREVTVIQWDVARKAFESKEIANLFPMGDGVVHNGVKLSAGLWLMKVVVDWINNTESEKDFLLIEAPLVGHRFIEIMQKHDEPIVEAFLSSDKVKVVVPIPSKEVRIKIEESRRSQLKDEAKTWMGAKPSVMLLIWKELCELANILGVDVEVSEQPPYDPGVYEYVFQKVLQHRHFIPLYINEIFEVSIADEKELHSTGSLYAESDAALEFAQQIKNSYPNENTMDTVTESWYKT